MSENSNMGIIEKWKKTREALVNDIAKQTLSSKSSLTYEDVLQGRNDCSDYFANGQVIPLKEQMRRIEKLSTGLFPHEQLILQIAGKAYVMSDHICVSSKYGIKKEEYAEIINSFLEKGLLQKADTVVSIAAQSNISQLKTILKDNNLAVSGLKRDLIDRIVSSIGPGEVQELFPSEVLVLTNKGKLIASTNKQIFIADRGLGENISVWNVTIITGECDNTQDCFSALYNYYQERCDIHKRKKNYGLSRNCRLSQYELSMKAAEFDRAIDSLAEVVLYDLNNIGNGFSGEYKYANNWFPYDRRSPIVLPPMASSWLNELKGEISLDDVDFYNRLRTAMEKIDIPRNCFSVNDCVEICKMEMLSDEEGLIQFYRNAESIMRKEHPNWFSSLESEFFSWTEIIKQLKQEFEGITLDEIKSELPEVRVTVDDGISWVLKNAMNDIASQANTMDDFWTSLERELNENM